MSGVRDSGAGRSGLSDAGTRSEHSVQQEAAQRRHLQVQAERAHAGLRLGTALPGQRPGGAPALMSHSGLRRLHGQKVTAEEQGRLEAHQAAEAALGELLTGRELFVMPALTLNFLIARLA